MMLRDHGYTGKRDITQYNERPQDQNEKRNLVFPNPVNNVLTVETVHRRAKIMIYDPEGRLIRQETGKQKQIDMSAFTSGMYFVSIIAPDDSIETFKVIKQ